MGHAALLLPMQTGRLFLNVNYFKNKVDDSAVIAYNAIGLI